MIRVLFLASLLSPAQAPAAPAAVQAEQVEQAESARPNIVLILADDLGLGDLGVYNPASKIPTPNLDRLAREGTRLTDAHSASAVCTPTRYALLTGRYAWRTRLKKGVLWGKSTNLIDPERTTLPEFLSERGYRTAGVGKWHLGLGAGKETDWSEPLRPGPLDHGFDTYFGIPASLDMPPYVYVLDDGLVQPATERVAGSGHRRQDGGGFWRAGAIARDFRHDEVLPRSMQRAVEHVERYGRDPSGQPFFLYLALSAPHTPWVPTEAFAGQSRAGHYGDFVAQVDHVVGEVVAAIERMGLARETLVVFTSDNGAHWPVADVERYGHAANLGYRGQKADIWEGGHRVPLIARWPGVVPEDAVQGDLFCQTDLFATLAALTGDGLEDDVGEDGFDQSRVLLGIEPNEPVRTHVVNHSLDGMFAVREGLWKLIEARGSGGFTAPKRVEPEEGEAPGQLYHLGRDPGETHNVYLDHPQVVQRLAKVLAALRAAGRSRPVRTPR